VQNSLCLSGALGAVTPRPETRPSLLIDRDLLAILSSCIMKLLSGRSFIVVMAVFSCATATGCFSCSEKTVNQPTPAVVVQPAPVVVEPTP
jgi:hypothetical protein